MMTAFRHLFVVALLIACIAASALADTTTVEVNTMAEISVTSSVAYANPEEGVTMTCTFVCGARSETVEGFWAGGATYRFRFAPPSTGVWHYTVACSDAANARVCGVEGDVIALPSTSSDPYRSKGWVKVASDHHYLTYDDDDPYFYLADTAWEITWKSILADVEKYISDRKRKGFNGIQIVTMSHQIITADGIVNQHHEPYYIGGNFDLLNPRYFDYLDTIVRVANDSGLAVVIAPHWAAFSELYRSTSSYDHLLTRQQSMLVAHYVGARYAGSNVIWIVGGDNTYETDEKREFWGEFAHALRAASGGRHLVTCHPHGWGSSFQYFGNEVDWMDFNMYQSSHTADIVYTYETAKQGYDLKPHKPVLNGEAVYEDITNRFWEPGADSTSPGKFRFTARDVRQASYESVLSGAFVGMTYGAHGIWQWWSDTINVGSYNPRYSPLEAIALPGSAQMGIMKDLLIRYQWQKMAPRADLAVESDSGKFVPIAASDRRLLAYARHHLADFRLNLIELGPAILYRWIDPRTGRLGQQDTALATGSVRFQPPDTNDWLLLVESTGTFKAASGAEVNGVYELVLASDSIYANPEEDVTVTCTFTGPGGAETVEGFWDGGRLYRVRFSPRRAGFWSYVTACSDTNNRGLHGVTGGFTAVTGKSDDPYRTKGWLKVSKDHHALSYENDDPYYYLGDTAWEIVWRSFSAELGPYISDRRSKGFNAVQIVPMSHQVMFENGITNRDGASYYVDAMDWDLLNPRYFDYLDTIVRMANDSGLAVVIAPLWAQFTEEYKSTSPQRFLLNDRQSMLIAHYIGARYAGSNVIWIVGGDNTYETDEKREFWGRFAHALRAASGGRHMVTCHPHGWGTSYQYFGNDVDWMDFNMYQSSHTTDIDFTYVAARKGYDLQPYKPLLNGEAAYEDIIDKFWAPGDDSTSPGKSRLTARDVRQASYESVLSGALVGMAYGAHGIWQWWNDTTQIGSYYPRYTPLEAITLPGSTQMGIMKDLLVRYQWQKMAPRADLVTASDSNRFVPVAKSDSALLAYLHHGMRYVELDLRELGSAVSVRWIDPRTGEHRNPHVATTGLASLRIWTPDTNDWLLLATPVPVDAPQKPTPVPDVRSVARVKGTTPNPFRGASEIDIELDESGIVTLELFDVTGRLVSRRAELFERGSWPLPVDGLTPGAYYFRIGFGRDGASTVIGSGHLISLGR